MEEIKLNLIDTVSYLSEGIGQRSYLDIDKLDMAAQFIEKKLVSFGCAAERQPFSYRNNLYYNIIGEVQGTEKIDNGILVIGAHYDTVIGTPGADDNASGIAGLLELARLAAAEPFRKTVCFAAFCLEEPPVYMTKNMGSYIHAKSLSDAKTDVYGMISLEMLGYYSDHNQSQYYPNHLFSYFYPDKGNFIAFVGNISSMRFTEKVKSNFKTASSFPVESLNGISIIPGVDFSDHRNFWKFGYPAFMITDTGFYRNPNYHAHGDTSATLNYDLMAELVSGLYRALKIL